MGHSPMEPIMTIDFRDSPRLCYAPPPRLPRWLPHEITRFVRVISTRVEAPEDLDALLWWHEDYRTRIVRLVTAPDMERVWTRLAKAPLNPIWIPPSPTPGQVDSLRELFLVSYLRTAAYPGQSEAFIQSMPSREEIQDRLLNIARVAETLCDLLGGPAMDWVRFTPWLMLEAASGKIRLDPKQAALRQNLLALQAIHQGHYWQGSSSRDHLLSLWHPFASLTLQLETLGLTARLAAKTQPKTPKRTRTRYPRFLIQALAREVDRYLSQHHWQAIATTVNVALALNHPITESQVRSCAGPGAGKSRKNTPHHA